jgi:hypothetical protein
MVRGRDFDHKLNLVASVRVQDENTWGAMGCLAGERFDGGNHGNFCPDPGISPTAMNDVFSLDFEVTLTVSTPFSAKPFLGASKVRQYVSSIFKTRSGGAEFARRSRAVWRYVARLDLCRSA